MIYKYNICITHGNGPQVGAELSKNEIAMNIIPPLPLNVLVANTQGAIGYMIQQSLQNALYKKESEREVVTFISQMKINADDPSLKKPEKSLATKDSNSIELYENRKVYKDKALMELSFPIVLKPKSGWGQRGFNMINNINEYEFYINNITNPENYMIQEFIDDKEGEFTNSVSVALDGDILGCICMKRELVKGNSRLITIDEYPEVEKQMIAIVKEIGSPGPINLQCRVKNGIAYVFEINPRFSSTVLFRHLFGFKDLEWTLENAIGIPLSAYNKPNIGKKFYKGFNEYIDK